MPYTIQSGAILEYKLVYADVSAVDRQMNVYHRQYVGPTITDGGFTALHIAQNEKSDLLRSAHLWRLFASQSCACVECHCQWIYPTRYALVLDGLNSLFGNVSKPQAPPATAVRAEMRGDRANRQNVGGLSLTGFANDICAANGQWNTLYKPQMDDFMSYIVADANYPDPAGGTFKTVIYHRAAPPTSALVMSYGFKPECRQQSRRVVGRGI